VDSKTELLNPWSKFIEEQRKNEKHMLWWGWCSGSGYQAQVALGTVDF
jgi:hypothetical protein